MKKYLIPHEKECPILGHTESTLTSLAAYLKVRHIVMGGFKSTYVTRSEAESIHALVEQNIKVGGTAHKSLEYMKSACTAFTDVTQRIREEASEASKSGSWPPHLITERRCFADMICTGVGIFMSLPVVEYISKTQGTNLTVVNLQEG